MNAKDLTPRQVQALAQAHVWHFQKLIAYAARGAVGIRVAECERYLEIWQETSRRALLAILEGRSRVKLTKVGRSEVEDAVDCGDYNELLERTKGEDYGAAP